MSAGNLSKFLLGILCCVQLLLLASVRAQTAADVENIVRNSKGVNKSRPLRAMVGQKQITISTYCHPKATDTDCKINSLFIMKDLLQHFKSIPPVHINFFDPVNAVRYRTVVVKEGDAFLVDSGKPVEEVLSQIEISTGRVPTAKPATSKMPASKATHYNSAPIVTGSANFNSSGSSSFTTRDGDLSLILPDNWVKIENPEPGTVLKCYGPAKDFLHVYRHQFTSTNTYENMVKLWEIQSSALPGWRKTKDEHQSARGYSGIYQEGSYEPGQKVRIFYLHGRDNLYLVVLMGPVSIDREMDSSFRRILSSISVRS